MNEVAELLLLLIATLVWGPSFINGDTNPSHAAALRIMYSSLNSTGQLTKWSSTGGDPCGESWKGITCSGSAVTEIKLLGLGLSGTMRWQLTSLTSLTNLNLGRNQLQAQLSDMYGHLSSLSTLDLSFNSLTGDLPESFSSLSSMTNMYLQNNQFTGTIEVLEALPLKNLNVENNCFNGWIPETLKNINLQKGGNSWNSGSAPPPPPGTPPRSNKSGSKNSPSNGGSKSGIGGGSVAGIVISILVVGAVVAFFIMKRRSRRSSTDVEKLDS